MNTAKTISSLTPLEKKTFVKYLILIWNRPTEAREHMKESFEKGIIEFLKMNPELELPENAIQVINEDYLRLLHEGQILRFLDETSEFILVDRTLNFNWILIETKNQNFFLISDNPIIFYNSNSQFNWK